MCLRLKKCDVQQKSQPLGQPSPAKTIPVRDASRLKTFFTITLPLILPGILSGALFAFVTSFDEVIVTTFTAGQQSTLPIWMLEELVRPRQRPVTNVVAMVVVLVTFLPILGAYYLTRDGDQVAGSGK